MSLKNRGLFSRLAFMALAISLAVVLLGLLQGGLALAQEADATNHADVVVALDDGTVLVRRITFITPTISGLEALRLTGLDLEIAEFDFGAAVCGIEGTGCPATNCFCDSDSFWAYQALENGAWQTYQVGAGDTAVSDRSVEGWIWGSFDASVPAVSAEFLAAQGGLQWLQARQHADGSIGQDMGATLDTVLAVAAANQDPSSWRSNAGASVADFVHSQAVTFANREDSKASAGKLALAIAAMDRDPRSFAEMDLLLRLRDLYDEEVGEFGTSNWDQAFSMLGWRASGEVVPVTATRRLASRANPDGGWGWNTSTESDVDTTALALQALIASGEPLTSTSVVSGLAYLQAAQNADGGWPYTPDSPTDTRSNSNSTAFAIQALLAAGHDPQSPEWTMGNNNPVSFLLSQQLPEGSFLYTDSSADGFATRQAIPALLGKTLDSRSRAVARRKAVDWISNQIQADGSFAGFNPGATIDAIMALATAGHDPLTLTGDQELTALDYLATQAGDYAAQGASAAGKLAAGIVAAGGNPRDFGGVDVVDQIMDYLAESGQFGGGTTWDQAWAMLGLAAARQPVPALAAQYLESLQQTTGGWGFDAQSEADTDSTALALQALAVAGMGRESEAVHAGLEFLHSIQALDGGFPGFDGSTNAGSTGLAIQALAAFGESPRGLAWSAAISDSTRLVHPTPWASFLSLQSPEGGFPGFAGANDPFATYQATPAIAGSSYGTLAIEGMMLKSQRSMERPWRTLQRACRMSPVSNNPLMLLCIALLEPPR